MKNLVLLIVIAVIGLTRMNAQEIQFGAKAGLNFATITNDAEDELDITSDVAFGLLAEIPISEKFSFQPELMYSGQGSSTAILTYFNVPLIGKYYVVKGLSLEAGPQIGFLLSAKNTDTDANIKDAFTNVDFGLGLGVGYTLNNGLFFNARYNLGIANISNVEGVTTENRFVQLSIGYFFF
ncbi:porin family protein [uncultured Dokdonia sp.]|uniref:porin family protein n=1 Tax=uncultured Dokdonia sp. TaxID=575653 RepID=UPI00262B5B52|nr:porin family protein [uncultured Dokdonia sp.]